jgi:hypothetical protein
MLNDRARLMALLDLKQADNVGYWDGVVFGKLG